MEKVNLPQKPKVFYGYWIAVAAFFCLFISSSCGFYAFSLFIKPLQASLDWGRGEIMAAFTILFLVRGAALPFIGVLIDRYGARIVIFIGALIAGLGFILLSLMHNLWHFYSGWAVVGVGLAAMSSVPATAIVLNWFKKRGGMAIGLMSTGVGAGGLLAPLVGGYLLPNFGWRSSYLALALLIWVVIIPLALLVIKTKPADIGLYPNGIPEVSTVNQVSPSTGKGLTLKIALATPALWLIVVSFLTKTIGHGGVVQSQVPYLEDIGFPVAMAAGSLGVYSVGSLISKLGFGWLCDRIPAKYACSIGLGFQLVAIIILMSVEPASPQAIIWLYAIVMGVGAGSWLPTMSMLISTNFGLTVYASIYSVVAFAWSIGMAIGPLMAGHMYDTMGTYHWAFIICAVLCVVAILAVLAVRRPKSLGREIRQAGGL